MFLLLKYIITLSLISSILGLICDKIKLNTFSLLDNFILVSLIYGKYVVLFVL